jgi:hypothetical protein
MSPSTTPLPGRGLSGRILSGRILSGRILPGRILPGRILPGRILSGAAALALAAGGALASLPAQAATAVPSCTNTDLSASYRHSDNGAGHSYGWIVLRNTSSHACRTGGYAGVSYVGEGNGTQIGAPAVRIDAADIASYVVTPGQRLRSPLDEVNASNYPKTRCRPAHVDGFRIYVPNSTSAQFVVHPHLGCRNPNITLMFEKPLRRP